MEYKDQDFECISDDRKQEIEKVFATLNQSELSMQAREPDDYYGVDKPFKELSVLKYRKLEFKLTSGS